MTLPHVGTPSLMHSLCKEDSIDMQNFYWTVIFTEIFNSYCPLGTDGFCTMALYFLLSVVVGEIHRFWGKVQIGRDRIFLVFCLVGSLSG